MVTGPDGTGARPGRAAAAAHAGRDRPRTRPFARAAPGTRSLSLWPHPGGIIQVVVRAELPSDRRADGHAQRRLQPRRAGGGSSFKALTNSEVAFVVGGKVQASTLPKRASHAGSLRARRASVGVEHPSRRQRIRRSSAATLPLTPIGGGATVATDAMSRPRSSCARAPTGCASSTSSTASLPARRSSPCSPRRSSATRVARTVTRPLGTITATMREMAATGDLTRKITLSASARWDDEDARLLATTFNSMTALDRPVPARGRTARAAVVARPAVDRRRARDPQPADDHQGGAARRCKREPVAAEPGADRGRGHRRGGRAAEPASSPRCSISRGRSSSTWRPVDLNALCDDAARAVSHEGPALVA